MWLSLKGALFCIAQHPIWIGGIRKSCLGKLMPKKRFKGFTGVPTSGEKRCFLGRVQQLGVHSLVLPSRKNWFSCNVVWVSSCRIFRICLRSWGHAILFPDTQSMTQCSKSPGVWPLLTNTGLLWQANFALELPSGLAKTLSDLKPYWPSPIFFHRCRISTMVWELPLFTAASSSFIIHKHYPHKRLALICWYLFSGGHN